MNFDFTSSEFKFSLNLHYKFMVFMKGHEISVKISLNLQILTFAFSVILHSNFEVLPVETPLILCRFPFVKLLINKCYDWSSKIFV